MITKKIHKQQRENFYICMIWTVILAFLAYIISQVYLYGSGISSSGRRFGLKGMFVSFLRKLEEQGHEDLTKWILIIICGIAGIYVFIQLISSLRYIMPKLTKLGYSICIQAMPNENFKELCKQIDYDMERGYKEFGASVFVSSSWILEEEVMRLNRIQKIYNKMPSGEKIIILEDIDGNRMTIEFFIDVSRTPVTSVMG